MSSEARLRAAILPPADLRRRRPAWLSCALGGAVFGPLTGAAAEFAFPVAAVRAPLLLPKGAHIEIWFGGGHHTSGRQGTVAWRSDDRLLFGVAVAREDDHDPSPRDGVDRGTPLQRTAMRLYGDIFDSLDRAGFPHLLRVWNFVPEINRETHGTERYRQFNIGRHEAFATKGRATAEGAPAASAVGVEAGPLAVHFLAARVPPCSIENPRQVSAYRYPSLYGPRSPTFSRASLTRLEGQDVLFVSGTASIVDHRSVHIGDVAAQASESLVNLAAVIEQANGIAARSYDPAALNYRIYMRHAADVATIRGVFERMVGPDARAMYLRADICREELLVEIEASGGYELEFPAEPALVLDR